MVNFELFTLLFLQFIVSRCVVNGIINGNRAPLYKFPSYVSIYSQNCSTFQRTGGGFFASKNVIVTTAACVESFQHVYVFPYVQKDNRFIYSGAVDSFNRTGKFMQIALNVTEIHFHPQYNSSTSLYNVAVLILGCDIPESKYLKYATLCKCGETKENDLLTVAGFGRFLQNENASIATAYPTRLQETKLRRISGAQCIGLVPDYTGLSIPNRTDAYCVFKPDGLNGSLCFGDSGSSVYQTCKRKQTVVGLGLASLCDPNIPSVFQSVCNPETISFINQYVYRIRTEYSDPCKECVEPTNQCPLNQPAMVI